VRNNRYIEIHRRGSGHCLSLKWGTRRLTRSRTDSADQQSGLAMGLERGHLNPSRRMGLANQVPERRLWVEGARSESDRRIVGRHLEDWLERALWALEMIWDCPDGVLKEA
jgi:hypothetical protein